MAGSDRTAVDAALAGGDRVRIDARLWWGQDDILRLCNLEVGIVYDIGSDSRTPWRADFMGEMRIGDFPTYEDARSAVEQAVREALAG